MAAEKIFVTEGGFEFRFPFTRDGVAVDISGATAKAATLRSPAGVNKDKTSAAFVTDGTDGLLKYTTVAADIDAAGLWKVQGKVVLDGEEVFSEVILITAVTPLEDK